MRALQRLANERAQAESRIRMPRSTTACAKRPTRRDATIHEAEDRNSIGRVNAQIEYESIAPGSPAAVRARSRHRPASSTKTCATTWSRRTPSSCGRQRTRSKNGAGRSRPCYEATKERPREQMLETEQRLNAIRAELAVLEQDATAIMKMRRQWREFPPVDPQDVDCRMPTSRLRSHAAVDPAPTDPVDAAVAIANAARGRRPRGRASSSTSSGCRKLFEDEFLLVPFLVAWAIAAVLSGSHFGWPQWHLWLPVSAGLAAVVAVLFAIALFPRARRQSAAQFQVVRQQLVSAYTGHRHHVRSGSAKGPPRVATVDSPARPGNGRDRRTSSTRRSRKKIAGKKRSWTGPAANFPHRLAELRSRFEQELAAVDRKFNETLAQLADERDRRQAGKPPQPTTSARRELRADFDRDWKSLTERWHAGYAAHPGSLGQHRGPVRTAVSRLGSHRRRTTGRAPPTPRRRSLSAASASSCRTSRTASRKTSGSVRRAPRSRCRP